MSNQRTPVEIPNKASFKPAEVCDLLGIPAYVLRTWENEFGDLGVSKTSGAARGYRRRDVELALRIRELVFSEHLTLAGVRRRLEQEGMIAGAPEEEEVADTSTAAMSEPVRAKIAQAKQELRTLLQQLAEGAHRELASAGPAIDASALDEPLDGASMEGAVRGRGKGDRSRTEPDPSPVLPGMDDAPSSGERQGRVTGRGGKMDPSALNFASISAPPPAPAKGRRPARSSR